MSIPGQSENQNEQSRSGSESTQVPYGESVLVPSLMHNIADVLPNLRNAVERCLNNVLITWGDDVPLEYIPAVMDDNRPQNQVADIVINVSSPVTAVIIGIWNRNAVGGPDAGMRFMVERWETRRDSRSPVTSLHIGAMPSGAAPASQQSSGESEASLAEPVSPPSRYSTPPSPISPSQVQPPARRGIRATPAQLRRIREAPTTPPIVGTPVDQPMPLEEQDRAAAQMALHAAGALSSQSLMESLGLRSETLVPPAAPVDRSSKSIESDEDGRPLRQIQLGPSTASSQAPEET